MKNIPKFINIFIIFLVTIFLLTFVYVFLMGKIRGKNYLSVNFPLDFIKQKTQTEAQPKQETEKPQVCSEQETLKRTKLCTFLIGDVDKHGTGFLINPQGYLVTNYHVVNNSQDGYVKVFYQGDFHKARIMGFSVSDDLAVVKIDSGFTDCRWADSDSLALAEPLYAVGWPNSPYGESTITKGVFSRYALLSNENFKMIQTDSPINPGNSGGPLINKCGVVGVNTSKITWIDNGAPSEGLGYAIPSNHAAEVVQKILQLDNGEAHVPSVEKPKQGNQSEQDTPAEKKLLPNDLVTYDFDQVIFWEQRMIHDQSVLDSWKSAKNSENIDQNKLMELIDLAERSLSIDKKLWDGYTNSKITYGEVINLKEEYLLISKRMSYLSNELNITGSINAYKNCVDSWEKLENEYNKDFSEQKKGCENIIQ